MTRALSGQDVASRIEARFPGAATGADEGQVIVEGSRVHEVARFLHDDPELALNYLVAISSVDYIDYFEVLYRLVSIKHNHSAVMKARAFDREAPALPSVVDVWRGADLQEREVYDLMGLHFEGHPNMKRIMLWEGFEGHPLRKDFLLQRP